MWYHDMVLITALQTDLQRRQTMTTPTITPPQSIQEAVAQAQAQGWRLQSMFAEYAIMESGTPVKPVGSGFHIVNILICFLTFFIWLVPYLAIWIIIEVTASKEGVKQMTI